MSKQGTPVLAHLFLSASLYLLLHQCRGAVPFYFYVEWLFSALVSPIGIIPLSLGIKDCCTGRPPDPVSVAFMALFFFANSYLTVLLAQKILRFVKLIRQSDYVVFLIATSWLINIPFFVVSSCCLKRTDTTSVAVVASPITLGFYFFAFIIVRAIKLRGQAAPHDKI